jgi:hypothetical protein
MTITLASDYRPATASVYIIALGKQPRPAPMMIRMDQQMRDKLEVLAQAAGTSISEIVRLAVSLELPALMSGQTKLAAS